MKKTKLSSHIKLSVFFSRFLGYGKKQALPFSLAFIGYGLYALSQPAFAMLMEAFVRAMLNIVTLAMSRLYVACIFASFGICNV